MSEPVPDCEPPLLAQVSSIRMMPLPVLVGLGERECVFSLECRASSVTVFTLCLIDILRICPFSSLTAGEALTRGADARTNAMPRSRAAPLRATGDVACSACSRRIQRARGERLEFTGSHGSCVAPQATLGWRGAMAMAWARTNHRERAAAARLPPAPLAKLLHAISRVQLTHFSVQQPRRYMP